MPFLGRLIVAISACSAILISCKDDGGTTGPSEVETPEFVGNWASRFAISLFGVDYDINLSIDSDSSSRIIARDNIKGGDTVYLHEGTWFLNDNQSAIYLRGANCAKYDNETKTMTTFDCGDPLPMTINIVESDTWRVPIKDLLPIAESQGIVIEAEYKEIIEDSFLDLKRKSQS